MSDVNLIGVAGNRFRKALANVVGVEVDDPRTVVRNRVDDALAVLPEGLRRNISYEVDVSSSGLCSIKSGNLTTQNLFLLLLDTKDESVQSG